MLNLVVEAGSCRAVDIVWEVEPGEVDDNKVSADVDEIVVVLKGTVRIGVLDSYACVFVELKGLVNPVVSEVLEKGVVETELSVISSVDAVESLATVDGGSGCTLNEEESVRVGEDVIDCAFSVETLTAASVDKFLLSGAVASGSTFEVVDGIVLISLESKLSTRTVVISDGIVFLLLISVTDLD